jgi:hypothetical protein
MLERQAHTRIINSTFDSNRAGSGGGTLCTVMTGGWAEDPDKRYDLQTMLWVHDVFFNGTSATDKLLVGPYFRLNISGYSGTNATSRLDTDVNRAVTGIVHRRRLCDRGEYIAASQYCEECPPFQFSNVAFPHEQRRCKPATEAAIAPGGAVLVPIPGGEAHTSGVASLLLQRACTTWLSGLLRFLASLPLLRLRSAQDTFPTKHHTTSLLPLLHHACSLAWHKRVPEGMLRLPIAKCGI